LGAKVLESSGPRQELHAGGLQPNPGAAIRDEEKLLILSAAIREGVAAERMRGAYYCKDPPSYREGRVD
jgi:hypothetical protein